MTFLEAFAETTRDQLREVVSYRDGMDWKPGVTAITHAKGLCVGMKVGGWSDREREAWNACVRHHRELGMGQGSLITLAACCQAAVVAVDALAVGLPVKEYERLVEPWVATEVMPWLADVKAVLGLGRVEYADDGSTKVLIEGEWVVIERPASGAPPISYSDAELDVREEKADEAIEQTPSGDENPAGVGFTFEF